MLKIKRGGKLYRATYQDQKWGACSTFVFAKTSKEAEEALRHEYDAEWPRNMEIKISKALIVYKYSPDIYSVEYAMKRRKSLIVSTSLLTC